MEAKDHICLNNPFPEAGAYCVDAHFYKVQNNQEKEKEAIEDEISTNQLRLPLMEFTKLVTQSDCKVIEIYHHFEAYHLSRCEQHGKSRSDQNG